MPKTIDGNPIIEEKWDEAKAIAKKEGRSRDFAYITGIYKKMVECKSFDYSFRTEKFALEKKAGKYYVTGYISNTERDVVDDIITEKGLNSMLKQIEESTITLDYEHEAFRDDPTILPVGKIVKAKIDDRGLWVKAELNSNSPKFKSLWGSIKDGFLKAFSIAFKPVKVINKAVKDGSVRLIEELELLNVAITGTPVNESAVIQNYGMKSVMLKAISEVNKMEEEIKQPVEAQAEVTPEVKDEAKVEEKTEVPKKEEEAPKVEEESPKVEEKSESNNTSDDSKIEEKALKETVSELKSLIEKQSEELKSLKEKSVFKSKAPEEAPEVKQELKSVLDVI